MYGGAYSCLRVCLYVCMCACMHVDRHHQRPEEDIGYSATEDTSGSKPPNMNGLRSSRRALGTPPLTPLSSSTFMLLMFTVCYQMGNINSNYAVKDLWGWFH